MLDVIGQRRRIRKTRAFRKPLAHTGCPHSASDDSDRNAKSPRDRIAEGWNETAASAAGTWLRIISQAPTRAIQGRHQPRRGMLLLLAMVGRVGLSSNDKHFADAHVLNHC